MSTEKIYSVEKSLGVRLKEKRKAMGLTQEELGDKLKISKDYVSKIEKGTREPSEIVLQEINRFLQGGSPTVPTTGQGQSCGSCGILTRKQQILLELCADEVLLDEAIKHAEKEKLFLQMKEEMQRKKAA